MKRWLVLLVVAAAASHGCGAKSRRSARRAPARPPAVGAERVAAPVAAEPDVDEAAPAEAAPVVEEAAPAAEEPPPPPVEETPIPTTGAVQEVWTGIPGNEVALLTGNPKYSETPDEARVLASFESGQLADAYGSRTTALLTAPETGDYTFWIASDDGGELWLSTDESEGNARLVASVRGWTGEREWTSQKGQESGPVRLEKGGRYFIRAFQKEGGGGDHMAVAWRGPGIERGVIPGEHLAPPELAPELLARLRETIRMDAEREKLAAEVVALIEKGETLPVELAKRLPKAGPGPREKDTGVNVLLDQAHQTSFVTLWGLKGQLWDQGFRVATSIAALDSVLAPGKPSRIRYPFGGMEPFTWWPNPEFNVVITRQTDTNAQPYTEDERAAVKRFVESGGGLLVIAPPPRSREVADEWSMNRLLGDYGARLTHEAPDVDGRRTAVLELGAGWEAVRKDDAGRAVRARRELGKGRVMVWGSEGDFLVGGNDSEETKGERYERRAEALTWLAAGKPPVGGDPGMPGGGGVNIFPEREVRLPGINIYYAANQTDEARECLEKQVPAAYEQVRKWLPSKVFAEPYNMVICAGGGGGWAIGGRPKASAIIEYKPYPILGVMAHEVAHTLGGPRNEKGELAGHSPHGNQGEAHAGWFQGKVWGKFCGDAGKSNRNCNGILEVERKAGEKIDLAKYDSDKWGKGRDWTKWWWVWQKLDDRYGPTWYPRWYWVRSTRWMDEPAHRETFDEMVEDMSIAVAEDLFPFFRSMGSTVGRERLERIEFLGETLELPVARIDTGPGGNVNVEEIGDYKRPLPARR